MGFNLFGSSKGADNSTSVVQTDSSYKDIDTNTNSGDGLQAGGDISVLDGGAIDEAFSFGSEALGFAESTVSDAFEFGGDALTAVNEANDTALDSIVAGYSSALGVVESATANENQTTSEAIQKIGMMLVAGLVVSFGLMVWGKK